MPQVHLDDRDLATAAWKFCLATHTLLDVEFRIRRKDGELFLGGPADRVTAA